MYKAMTMLHNFKEGKAWTDGQFGLHKPPSCLSATQVEQNGCCDIEGKTRAHLWGWGTTWYDEQDEKRAATEIPLFAPRSKYHLSNWPLSRERLIPRLVWLLFFSVSQFYYRSCHGHLLPLPPSWSLRDFFRTLIQGFVVFVQGLPLNSDFWNGVHSVDESVISPRTRDVLHINRQGISRFAQFTSVFLIFKYFVLPNRKHNFAWNWRWACGLPGLVSTSPQIC